MLWISRRLIIFRRPSFMSKYDIIKCQLHNVFFRREFSTPLLTRRLTENARDSNASSVFAAANLARFKSSRLTRNASTATDNEENNEDNNSDMSDNSELEPELQTSLLDAVSDASSPFVASLISNVTSKHFRLESVKAEVLSLQDKRLPLPRSLDEQMWHFILKLQQRRSRTLLMFKLSEIEWGTEWSQEAEKERELRLANVDKQSLQKFMDELEQQDQLWTKGLDFSFSNPKVQEAFDSLKENEPLRAEFNDQVADIEAAYNKCRQMGEMMPLEIASKDLLYLLKNCESERKIASTLSFLAKTESVEFGDQIDKRARRYWGARNRHQMREARSKNSHLVYALGHNIFLIRMRESTMLHADNWREAMSFHEWGVPLVIDLQFLKHMEWKKIKSMLYREMNYAVANNRMYKEPFALHLCNVDLTDEKTQVLLKAIPNLLKPEMPICVTEKSYMDLFPRKNLLYLSPHSRVELDKVDFGNDIYIIGGCFSNNQDSLITAKKDNIRHARLPLRRVVGMNVELNVDHMVGFMHELKRTEGDFEMAARWIPPRKYGANFKATGNTDRGLKALYLAHKELALMTNDPWTKVNITPKAYKRLHQQRLSHYLEQLKDQPLFDNSEEEDESNVYVMDTKGENRQKKRAKSFHSFLKL